MSRLRGVYESVVNQIELWNKSAAAQLDAQLRERRRNFVRRIEAVSRIQDAFAKALADPTVQERLSARGYISEVRGSADVSAFIKAEAARWKMVVKENNITSED